MIANTFKILLRQVKYPDFLVFKGNNMLRIAICDDEIKIQEQLKKYIFQYFFQRNKDVEIHCFTAADELLCASCDYQILFLDIMLDNNNDGIKIGKILRERDNTALYIIITSRTDRFADAYEATVFRYLVKPYTQKEIDMVLDQAIKYFSNNKRTIPIYYRQQTDYVNIKDVILIESYMRKRYIHTKTQKYQTTETWNSLLTRLSSEPCFYNPQKSFLVNLHHIKSNTKASVIMDNGREIALRKGAYKEFQEAFNKFLGDINE